MSLSSFKLAGWQAGTFHVLTCAQVLFYFGRDKGCRGLLVQAHVQRLEIDGELVKQE